MPAQIRGLILLSSAGMPFRDGSGVQKWKVKETSLTVLSFPFVTYNEGSGALHTEGCTEESL